MPCWPITAPAARHRAADTWPLFRGNSLATGVVAGSLPEKLEVLWKFQGKEGGFEATAVIDDELVYVGSLDGNFYAIDLATGEERWKYHTELGFSAAAAVRRRPGLCRRHRRQVLLLRRRRRQAAVGLRSRRPKSTRLRISTRTWCCSARKTPRSMPSTPSPASWPGNIAIGDQIRCSPTVVDGRALVAGCDGKLHIVDLDDGEEIGARRDRLAHRQHAGGAGRSGFFRHRGGNLLRHRLARRPRSSWTAKAERGPVDPLVGRGHRRSWSIVGARDKRVHAFRVSDGNEAWNFTTRSRVDSCRWWSASGCSSARETAGCTRWTAKPAKKRGIMRPAASSPPRRPWPPDGW